MTSNFRSCTSQADAEVLFELNSKKVGLITMNRPKALNSLNLNMARMMYQQMSKWKQENAVKMVVVEGAGNKAYCAGGDIVSITKEKGSQYQKDFFKEEYILDHLTSSMGVPYVALIDGIVMGGGVGLSVHGDIRIATEKTLFAMPETGIGLFPDVGGSHFLPRLKGELGMYLALTGYRLKGYDNVMAGIATHACPSEKMPQLKEDLLAISDMSELEDILQSYNKLFPKQPFSLAERIPDINRAFSKSSVEEILSELSSIGGDWCNKQIETLRKMSPASVKVTFRQLREGAKKKSLAECLEMEYRIARMCCEDNDFYEGVRALLVDKDQNPKWKPQTLEDVSDEFVQKYFDPLKNPQEELVFKKSSL